MTTRRRSEPRVRKPVDAARLGELALAYVARFATTRARLRRYLQRKVLECGWDGAESAAARIDAIVDHHEAQGFVDDRRFAESRADGLARRGYGVRRIRQTLWADGIEADDAEPVIAAQADGAWDAAIAYARRRRYGPFAAEAATDPKLRQRQIAAFIRAGHTMDAARRILAMPPGASLLDEGV